MKSIESNVQTVFPDDDDDDDDQLVRVRDAASSLAVCKGTVYGLMEKGLLSYVQIGRARRIPMSALIAFRERNLVGSSD